MKSLLITFEGIDACGKTSTVTQVEKLLNNKGIKTICLNKKAVDKYPTEFLRDYMSKVSSIIWEFNSKDPVAQIPEEAWVFKHALWYTMLNQYIIESLKNEYEVILIDGWYYKFLARHLSNGDYNFDLTFKIFDSVNECDFIYLLDVSPEVCFNRRENFKLSELGEHGQISDQSPRERFIKYQCKVRNNYHKLATNDRWKILEMDNKELAEVSEIVANSIGELLKID